MPWLTTAAVIVGALVAGGLLVLGALVWRQWSSEDDVVEMPGGEMILGRPPRREWSAPPRPRD